MDIVINTITDKKSRTINIGQDIQDIVAEHDGLEIARWTFDEDADGNCMLGVMDMNTLYRRAGIGEEMLRVAEALYSDFHIADHFSEEGAGFFNGCGTKGITTQSHKAVRDDRY